MIEILSTVGEVAWAIFDWQVNSPLDVLGLLFIVYLIANRHEVLRTP